MTADRVFGATGSSAASACTAARRTKDRTLLADCHAYVGAPATTFPAKTVPRTAISPAATPARTPPLMPAMTPYTVPFAATDPTAAPNLAPATAAAAPVDPAFDPPRPAIFAVLVAALTPFEAAPAALPASSTPARAPGAHRLRRALQPRDDGNLGQRLANLRRGREHAGEEAQGEAEEESHRPRGEKQTDDPHESAGELQQIGGEERKRDAEAQPARQHRRRRLENLNHHDRTREREGVRVRGGEVPLETGGEVTHRLDGGGPRARRMHDEFQRFLAVPVNSVITRTVTITMAMATTMLRTKNARAETTSATIA